MKPVLVILAAGMGNRYGGLKQLDKLGPSDETLMDYSIYDAVRAGISKVIFIIKHAIEHDFRQLTKKYDNKIEVDFAFQEINFVPDGVKISVERTKPWGTAHALLMAAKKVDSSFISINADDFYGFNSYKTLVEFLLNPANKNDFAMIGFPVSNALSEHGAVSRGICLTNHEDYLQEVIEKTHIQRINKSSIASFENEKWVQINPESLVSMNIWGLTPAIFPLLESSFSNFIIQSKENPKSELLLPGVIDDAIKQNFARVKVLNCNAEWFGMTYQADKPFVKNRIKKLIDSGEYPETLFA